MRRTLITSLAVTGVLVTSLLPVTASDAALLARPDYPAARWVAADPHNWGYRDDGDPTAIALHTFDPVAPAVPDYDSTIQFFANPNAGQTSAHYVIRSRDGDITQMVENRHRANHVRGHNNETIGIEHEATSRQEKWYTDIMMRSSAALVRDLCERYLIPRTGSSDPDTQSGGIKGHNQFSGHEGNSDPGKFWYERHDAYLQKVRGGKRDAAVPFGGQYQIFQRQRDNSVQQRVWDGSEWRDWAALGGSFAGEPAAVAFGRQMHVFGIDRATRQLRTRYWDPSGGWSNWAAPGGTTTRLRGNPSAVVIGQNLHVFARGEDNEVYEARWSGGAWRWTNLGGTVVGDPAALDYGGQAQVYALGSDQRLYSNVLGGSGWGGWTKSGEPGARLTGTPSVIRFGGQAQAFVQGLNGNVYQAVWNPGSGWTWHNLGGAIFGDPSATVVGSTVRVAALGTDSQLWTDSWSANGWTGWQKAAGGPSGGLTGTPTAMAFGNQLQVTVQGMNGRARQPAWQPGSNWWWADLGGTAAN